MVKPYAPEEDRLLHNGPQQLLIHLGLIVQQVINEQVDDVCAIPSVPEKK